MEARDMDEPSPRAVNRMRMSALRNRARMHYRCFKDVFPYHFILIFSGGLLLLLMVLLFFLRHHPHHVVADRCNSTECLKVAVSLIEKSNLTANACDDPWKWACGSWISQYPDHRNAFRNSFEEMEHIEMHNFNDLITTMDRYVGVRPLDYKMQILFNACMENDGEDLVHVHDILQRFKTLEQPHRSRNTKLVSVLRSLLREYGFEPIVKVTVVNNPFNAVEKILKISPANLGMPAYYYLNITQLHGIVKSYKSMLKEAFQLLGKSDYESRILAEDTYLYEKRIAEILPKMEVHHEREHVMKLHELVTLSGTVPIQEILSNYLNNFDLNGNSNVLVASPDFMTHLSYVFSHTDDRSMFGYLKTVTVRHVLALYSPAFRHSIQNFKFIMTGASNDVPQWQFCSSLINEITPLGFEGFIRTYREHRTEYEHRRRSVENVFRNVKNSLLEEIRLTPRMRNISSVNRKQLSDKLKTVKIQVAIPSSVVEEMYLKNYHEDLYVQNNYHTNLNQGFNFKIMKLQYYLAGNLSRDENLMFNMLGKRKVTYENSLNVITVPYYLTATPNFHEKFPQSVQYGRLGVMIGEALTTALIHFNETILMERNYTNLFYDIKYHTIKTIDKCENRTLERSRTQIARMITKNTLVKMIGLKIAGYGLMRDIGKRSEHYHIPGLEKHEDGEIFMLSYLQNECAIMTFHTDVWNEITEYEFPAMTILEMKISLMQNFFDDFSCPKRMYQNYRKCLMLHENVILDGCINCLYL